MATAEYLDAVVEELPKRARLPMWWSATSMDGLYWLKGVGCGDAWNWRGRSHPDETWPVANDLTSGILMAAWDVLVADGFSIEERRDALGRLDVRLRARDEGRICAECGAWDVYVEQGRRRWIEERMTAMAEHQACFGCSHWIEVMARKERVGLSRYQDPYVISQSWHVYQVGGENTSDAGFRGFGGAKYILRFHDGRTLRSSNLWSAGTLPWHFRARHPQNAEVVPVEGRKLEAEWATLDCHPPGAKTPARTGLE